MSKQMSGLKLRFAKTRDQTSTVEVSLGQARNFSAAGETPTRLTGEKYGQSVLTMPTHIIIRAHEA